MTLILELSAANMVDVRDSAPPVRQAYSETLYSVFSEILPALISLKTYSAVISFISEAGGNSSSSPREKSTVPVDSSIR